MKEYIKKMYDALETGDCELLDDTYSEIYADNVIQDLEDVVLICRLFTYNFNYVEPHQVIDIVDIMFHAINKYDLKTGFTELVKGMEEICSKSLIDNEVKNFPKYDESFFDILSSFVGRYEKKDMELLGQVINQNASQELREMLINALKEIEEFKHRRKYWDEYHEKYCEKLDILAEIVKMGI